MQIKMYPIYVPNVKGKPGIRPAYTPIHDTTCIYPLGPQELLVKIEQGMLDLCMTECTFAIYAVTIIYWQEL